MTPHTAENRLNISMLAVGAVCAALLLPAVARAQDKPKKDFTLKMIKAAKANPRLFTVDETTVQIERIGPSVKIHQFKPPKPVKPSGDIDIAKIINIAKKIWDIIKENRPVVKIDTDYATAVPAGTTSWGQLDSWKPPKGVIYELTAKNGFGSEIVKIRYQILYTYGGQYKGKGRYLTAVTVQPLLVEAGWGYNVSVTATVPDSAIYNVGTSENPLAAMMPTLKWSISTVIKESHGQGIYYIQGDGLFKEIGGPFKRKYDKGVADALKNLKPFLDTAAGNKL